MDAFEFDYSGSPEYSVDAAPNIMTIHVSKAGGGTVGQAYAGGWDTALVVDGHVVHKYEYVTRGQDALTTGTPKTHAEAARIYAEMMGEQLGRWSEVLAMFADDSDS
jgi:hypothetical protein